jgi:hypothetical protein
MSSDVEALEARVLIDSYGESSAMIRLAQLASPGCRIEPQMLRHLRLACVPDAGVTDEQQLWHSELIDSRGENITFRSSIARELRGRLRDWRARDPLVVGRAREVMLALHAELPQLLKLEDELAWAEVYDDDQAIRDGALMLLNSLLAQRDGLKHWLGRAWAGLPPSLKALPAGKQLAQVAAAEGATVAEEAGEGAEQVAHLLPLVPLPMKLHGTRLDVNVPNAAATHVLEIPNTNPKALSVSWSSGRESLVFSTETRGVDVSTGKIVLRTLAGTEYEIDIPGEVQAANTFEIELLPARHGTSLIIRYGARGETQKIVVDCGDRATGDVLVRALAESDQGAVIDLLVLTHPDEDRIGGARRIFEASPATTVHQVWFNASPPEVEQSR